MTTRVIARATTTLLKHVDRSMEQQNTNGEASASVMNVVALLHLHLAPFLEPEDISHLLRCCSHALSQAMRDAIATEGLKGFYRQDGVHFGRGCMGDWHQLVPKNTMAARSDRCVCKGEVRTEKSTEPIDLPLPLLLNAREHILEATCLISKGIKQYCFQVLRMDQSFKHRQFGTMQPILFSLAAALEMQQRKETEPQEEPVADINVDNVDELIRLMDSVEAGFGTRFFSATTENCTPIGTVEAHWRGISVDKGTTSCHYCEVNVDVLPDPKHTTAEYEQLRRQHCEAVYQPLKLFMTRHLKHVRYVHPPRGWNSAGDAFQGCELMDLIAGALGLLLYDRDFKRLGTLQPVVFSLAVALEKQQQQQQQRQKWTPAKINTNNTMQLTCLLNSVEPTFGSRFFRKVTRKPSGSVEAHWQGISVDLGAGTTTCQYCKNADKMLGRFGELVSSKLRPLDASPL
ncbi:hypothetical protein BBJ28_00004711 [Nothophytophthora sp. Chile5]|nr:hypothetical protein BBJ28_00004711 [Nothophytophthora sp. Chile5]